MLPHRCRTPPIVPLLRLCIIYAGVWTRDRRGAHMRLQQISDRRCVGLLVTSPHVCAVMYRRRRAFARSRTSVCRRSSPQPDKASTGTPFCTIPFRAPVYCIRFHLTTAGLHAESPPQRTVTHSSMDEIRRQHFSCPAVYLSIMSIDRCPQEW
ncbi:hypothetical protein B0H10DRAFT_2023219 [Mycena sp. CBHHK59/15]|nr:hypothetical protein B0H10DRAFT_2023219 [Mycena sp. CBHHK59/15]